jgi:SAM-dependent methyltransferase
MLDDDALRSAMMDVDQIDAALASGHLTEVAWYDRIRDLLETAYLATDDPQCQSGLNGDVAHWERRRHVIVEAVNRDGSFLDVGCANGLLMQSLAAWAQERGHHLEPYGLDISAKLAALARTRLPQWEDRIFVGNAITWEPPRRFDYVHTELVYVPDARQPELVSRLLNRVIAPGGRLIVCAYRPRGARDVEPVGEVLQSWGFPSGARRPRPI